MPRTKRNAVADKDKLNKLRSKKLTRRQELFVKELVSNDGQITMREAAINAGFPPSSAHTRAYEMTNPLICPHIVAAIKAYRDELDAKYGITYQRHVRDLQNIRDLAIQNGAYSAAVQAEYRRGQAQGDIYVSKSEIRHGSIDQMSKEEVMKALDELRDTYESNIIDVTPMGGSDQEEDQHDGEQLLQTNSGRGEEA
tara:strand:- start:1406 stop:1996 length:591 start_codon:yes stop_codon:yes gene_type:complete